MIVLAFRQRVIAQSCVLGADDNNSCSPVDALEVAKVENLEQVAQDYRHRYSSEAR